MGVGGVLVFFWFFRCLFTDQDQSVNVGAGFAVIALLKIMLSRQSLAASKRRRPANAAGPLFVDESCINWYAARAACCPMCCACPHTDTQRKFS